MKIKLFVAREIQYFELGIFSFNSYVYYLTRGFIASTRAFNLPTRAFNLATRAFSLLTRGFELVTREFELVTRGFELVTCGFELVTRGFELVTHRFELVTRILLFHTHLDNSSKFLLAINLFKVVFFGGDQYFKNRVIHITFSSTNIVSSPQHKIFNNFAPFGTVFSSLI